RDKRGRRHPSRPGLRSPGPRTGRDGFRFRSTRPLIMGFGSPIPSGLNRPECRRDGVPYVIEKLLSADRPSVSLAVTRAEPMSPTPGVKLLENAPLQPTLLVHVRLTPLGEM